MGGVPPAPPIFYGSLPRDEAVLPKHMPHNNNNNNNNNTKSFICMTIKELQLHIDGTLESLGTLHWLEGANIRSQTE